MGYIETLKAYQIFIPSKRRVVIRTDVKFEEERAYWRSREYDESHKILLSREFRYKEQDLRVLDRLIQEVLQCQ